MTHVTLWLPNVSARSVRPFACRRIQITCMTLLGLSLCFAGVVRRGNGKAGRDALFGTRPGDLEGSVRRFASPFDDGASRADCVSRQDSARTWRRFLQGLRPIGEDPCSVERRRQVVCELRRTSHPRSRSRVHLARPRGWRSRSGSWILERVLGQPESSNGVGSWLQPSVRIRAAERSIHRKCGPAAGHNRLG
jgi:hypothetical protein